MRFLKLIIYTIIFMLPSIHQLNAAEFAGFDVRNGMKYNIDRAKSYGYKCSERLILDEYKEIRCSKRTGRVDDELNFISFGDMGINIGCGVVALCHLQDFEALRFMLRQENDFVRQAREHMYNRTWMCWETASQNILCLTPTAEEEYDEGWSVQLYHTMN